MTDNIPYGYCKCGCGNKTKIATRTQSREGWVKGQPIQFVNNHHHGFQTIAQRFWAKVNREYGDNSCWNWTAALDKDGYGKFSTKAHGHTRSHRFAYQITYNTDPGELHVLHSCDNPKCCNPAHLFLGTNFDNMQDRNAKGRQSKGLKHSLAVQAKRGQK